MGTMFRLVFFASDATGAANAANAAFARVADINRVLSDYDPESEISRLERRQPGTAFATSSDLFHVLDRSQLIAERTHGAFDVTLGPLVGLWREARRTRRIPAESELSIARRACGARNVQLDSAKRTVTLLVPKMRLDFGGIAKGFAADEALKVLVSCGYKRAMVAAGGDLAIGDPPPGTIGWKIDLSPFGSTSSRTLRIKANNVGISTSGDSEQFVEIDGIRYSHIINPATGLGLTTPCAATVVAPDATQSDAWATACAVLSGERSIAACIPDTIRAWIFNRVDGVDRYEGFGRNPPGLELE
ncbi:MAG: FAD:protein FMN transferase [Opitutaceae bacterium]|nr:FAD:protein FMN transferase [Opitutaceae bacterium]